MRRKEHIKIDKFLLGYTEEGVHALMDVAVKYLGAGHRSVRHNIDFIREAERWFPERGGRIALLHLLVDNKIIDGEYISNYIKNQKKQIKTI